MKTTTILKQQFSVTSGFDEQQCLTAIKSQLSDKIFKELINGEKHSLVLNFSIDLNEDDSPPVIDKQKEAAMKIIESLKKIPIEKLKELDCFELSIAKFEALTIDYNS